MTHTGGEIKRGVPISKDQLLIFDGWNATAKAFIEQSNSEIELADVLRQYHDKVVDFQNWFESLQRDVHKDEWEYREQMTEKIHALAQDG